MKTALLGCIYNSGRSQIGGSWILETDRLLLEEANSRAAGFAMPTDPPVEKKKNHVPDRSV